MAEPLLVYEGRVQPDWIDYNRHMRDGYFAVVCSTATDNLMDHLGLDSDYRARTGNTFYTLELRLRFLAEIGEGEPFHITAQVLDADAKRLHVYLRMHAEPAGTLFATHESILLHVDQAAGPASAPFPEEIAARLKALREAHRDLPLPDDVGQPISMAKRKAAG